MIDADTQSRFWKKVQKTESCWNWIGGGRGNGYGSFRFQGKTIDTHRISWMIHHGSIPEGLCVLHSCDNRRCTNPSHLFLGTKKVNHDDMVAKGRKPGPKRGRRIPVQHGTRDEYKTFGCRCDLCKEAVRLEMQKYRASKRANKPSLPSILESNKFAASDG